MLALQEARHHEVRSDTSQETLFLLQHRSVVTLGKNASEDNLRLSTEEFRERKIDLVETGRGGDVTWHGPGQIVGYQFSTLAKLNEISASMCGISRRS